MENMSKPLVEFTFLFSWWILISNFMFDVLICINKNISLYKMYSRNKLCHCWKSPTYGFVQICNVQNVVLQVQMWLLHSWNVMKDNGLMTSQ